MDRIVAGDLEVAFSVAGDKGGQTVLLLHGWPDDQSTWDGLAPILASCGFRLIIPTLRGFGDTRFLDEATQRSGNSGILAMDAIALLDALDIERCAVVGHDWGSNTAESMAVGWPDRIERIAMLGTPARLGGLPTPPFWHAQLEWYHWFMATGRGAGAVAADRRGFTHIHWQNWGPAGWFDEATFDAVAASFDNPDWVDVTLHSYRSRWGETNPDPRSQWLEDKIRATKSLALPTIYFQGELDGVNPPPTARSMPEKFSGPFELVTVAGAGHFIQRQAPDRVAEKLVPFLNGKHG